MKKLSHMLRACTRWVRITLTLTTAGDTCVAARTSAVLRDWSTVWSWDIEDSTPLADRRLARSTREVDAGSAASAVAGADPTSGAHPTTVADAARATGHPHVFRRKLPLMRVSVPG
jgi:hypothetical protein